MQIQFTENQLKSFTSVDILSSEKFVDVKIRKVWKNFDSCVEGGMEIFGL